MLCACKRCKKQFYEDNSSKLFHDNLHNYIFCKECHLLYLKELNLFIENFIQPEHSKRENAVKMMDFDKIADHSYQNCSTEMPCTEHCIKP